MLAASMRWTTLFRSLNLVACLYPCVEWWSFRQRACRLPSVGSPEDLRSRRIQMATSGRFGLDGETPGAYRHLRIGNQLVPRLLRCRQLPDPVRKAQGPIRVRLAAVKLG